MQLRALGGLKLGGSTFGKPKPLLLLAYVLLEGPLERRHVAELFWPRAANHLNSLSQALSQVRRAAPGVLETDEARVWASLASDVGEVLDALEKGDEARAVGRYQAPFLEGVFLHGWGAELEEWVNNTREAVAGRVRGAHLKLAETAATELRVGEALHHAEAAFTLSAAPPLEPSELTRLHRLFLLGESIYLPRLRVEAEGYDMALEGTKQEAARSFQADKAPDAPWSLPTKGTTFIGRELERAELGEMLRRGDCRLVTVVGQGGTGKTRLALEVAAQQAEGGSFRDGVYFVELDTLADPGAVAPKVAKVLGLTLQGPHDPATQLQHYLQSRRSLLVFDNFEHLLAGAAWVSELLAACPHLKALVTSRERLHLEEEWLFSLGGLAYPGGGATLEEARGFDATQLFVERARRVKKSFELTEDTWETVAEICTLVEGSPLAIELAAGWVKTVVPEDLSTEMKKNIDILRTRTRNIPNRHQSIRAAFDHSWALLTLQESVGLSKLAVFQGGFTREEADSVADVPVSVLASLVDKSLVQEPRGGRYGLHPLLHQYALEKLLERPELVGTVQERHQTFYLKALQAWRDSEAFPSPRTIAALAPDIHNILAAWRRTFAAGCGEVSRAAEALTWYFEVRAQYHEGLEQLALAFETAFESAFGAASSERESCREVLGNLRVYQAWLGHWLENERAEAWTEEGLGYLRPLGAVDGIILGLRVLGIIAWRRGAYPEAERTYREALSLARTTRKRVWEAVVLDGLGLALSCQGYYEEAERCHAAALDLNRALDNPFQQVHNLANLAAVSRRAGRRDDLLTLAGQALNLARKIEFNQYVPYCVTELAWAHARLGAHGEAEATALEGYNLASSIGDNWTQAGALLLLGHLGTETYDFARAQGMLEQSAAIALANGDLSLVLRGLYRAARLEAARGGRERVALWLMWLGAHPALPHWTARAVRDLLFSVGEVLPPAVLEQLREQSVGLSLEEMLAAALPGASRACGRVGGSRAAP